MLDINGTIKLNKISLSGEDYTSLTQMYLPLIGESAFTVYVTLNNMLEDEVSIKKVLDLLTYNNLALLIRSLNKLEGIGLVKEYYKESKGTIIKLLNPLSPKAFLNNSLLNNYLITQIGETENQMLREYYFNNKKLKGYDDISKSFDEVYKRINEKNVFVNNVEIEEDNINIKNSNFDYIYFKMLFDKELPNGVLDEESFKEQILKISYQFELNEIEMHDAVMKSIVNNNDLSYSDIQRYAGYIFQNKKPNDVVSFTDKEVEVFSNDFDSNDMQILNVAKNKTIAQMLAAVSGGKGSLAEVRDFTKLIDMTGLSTGAINVMILYLAKTKQEQNLSYTYLEKIARNWMKAGVKTAEDALLIIKKQETKKSSRKVEEPDWMKDDNTNKNNDSTEIDLAEAEALKNSIFGGNDGK